MSCGQELVSHVPDDRAFYVDPKIYHCLNNHRHELLSHRSVSIFAHDRACPWSCCKSRIYLFSGRLCQLKSAQFVKKSDRPVRAMIVPWRFRFRVAISISVPSIVVPVRATVRVLVPSVIGWMVIPSVWRWQGLVVSEARIFSRRLLSWRSPTLWHVPSYYFDLVAIVSVWFLIWRVVFSGCFIT